MFDSLGTIDHQIVYGRRGTGKTHLLRVLKERDEKNVPIYIDLRTIGSTGGLQNDHSIALSERSNRLILDVLGHIHSELFGYVVSSDLFDLDSWTTALDNLATSITEVVVIGEKSIKETEGERVSDSFDLKAGLEAGTTGLSAALDATAEEKLARKSERQTTTKGFERCRIHFGRLRNDFAEITRLLGTRRLLILVDEWSEIPLEIQPILSDLLKRTLLATTGVTVKIAAIEKRSRFLNADDPQVGIEVGGDIPATIDLDEYLVFDNSKEKSTSFFESLIARHIRSLLLESAYTFDGTDAQLIYEVFGRADGFQEFVKAIEGVPRDAINILTLCCQLSKDDKIVIPDVRLAAKKWYNQGKEANLVNKDAKRLLRWVIDTVIGHRKARAFLLESDSEDPLIDLLYDMRLIHIIKKAVSSNDRPGERFIVYSIDYGCYVDLINTAKEPLGLFEIDEGEQIKYIEVPENDYRSIRRAILSLEGFRNYG